MVTTRSLPLLLSESCIEGGPETIYMVACAQPTIFQMNNSSYIYNGIPCTREIGHLKINASISDFKIRIFGFSHNEKSGIFGLLSGSWTQKSTLASQVFCVKLNFCCQGWWGSLNWLCLICNWLIWMELSWKLKMKSFSVYLRTYQHRWCSCRYAFMR